MVVEFGQGGEVGVQVYRAGATSGLGCAGEEVDKHVGTELVHGAQLPSSAQAASELVEAGGDGGDPVGWEVEAEQVGGAVRGGFTHHPPTRNRLVVPIPGRCGVGVDAEAPDASVELAGGEAGCVVDHVLDNLPGRGDAEVAGGMNDQASPPGIDLTGVLLGFGTLLCNGAYVYRKG